MRSRIFGETGRGSALLLAVVLAIGIALAGWKTASARAAAAAAAHQPEPIEVITTAVAQRSITLRTELAGTVSEVALVPGRIVDSGTVLVALDISVERADLQAQQAQAALAQTSLARLERLLQHGAVSAEEVDRARAERDIAQAQIARTEAIIAKKTIRAPFRARVGIADVHPGQYLNEGTQLTTLQGVDGAAHVDFAVSQQVAAGLGGRAGASIDRRRFDGDRGANRGGGRPRRPRDAHHDGARDDRRRHAGAGLVRARPRPDGTGRQRHRDSGERVAPRTRR